MTAVWIYAWAGLRARWRSWVLLAVVIALAGGSVLSFAAAARRTDTAYSRFLSAQRAADATVYVTGKGQERVQAFQRLPEVTTSAVTVALTPTESDFSPVVLADNRFGRTVSRFKLLQGRLPRRANETTVGFLFASSRHLRLGSPLAIRDPETRAKIELRVVGIEAAPGEFPPLSYASQQITYLSGQFLHTPAGRRWERLSGGAVALSVRLRGGSQQAAHFFADVEHITGTPVGTSTPGDQAAQVQDSMHLQALALWLMAGFTALAAALVLAQLFLREMGGDASDQVALRAMGMTSGQVALCSLLRVGAVTAAGAVGALGVAYGLSPLFPLGTAGIAEPAPGPSFDAVALMLGALAVAALLMTLGAMAAWRTSRRSPVMASGPVDGAARSPWVHNALKLGSLPVSATIGLRMAVRPGKGRDAVPVRSTLAAAVIAVAAMTTAVTFGSSLGHLLATPRLYGTTYDADVELNTNFGDIRSIVPSIRDDPAVAAVSVVMSGIPLSSQHKSFGAMATTEVRGSVEPTLMDGRLPRAAREIALGSRTMSELHTGIGQTIPVAVEGLTRQVPMRVVGRVVLAPVSDTQSLGRGGVVNMRAMTVFQAAMVKRSGFQVPPPGDALVRFRTGTAGPVGVAALERRLGGVNKVLVTAVTQPADVVNFGQVRDLPQILAALLSALAVITMGHLLVSAIRRRRHELAVLKALGLLPRQVSSAIAWQATAVATIALVVGLPLGLAAGRAVWSAVGGNIGVVVEPTIPWVWIALLVPATLLVANLVAALPAASAARVAPAALLRTE